MISTRVCSGAHSVYICMDLFTLLNVGRETSYWTCAWRDLARTDRERKRTNWRKTER